MANPNCRANRGCGIIILLMPVGRQDHYPDEECDERRSAPPYRRGVEPFDPAPGLSLTSPPSKPSANNSPRRWASPTSGTTRKRPSKSSTSSSRSTACSSPSRTWQPAAGDLQALAELAEEDAEPRGRAGARAGAVREAARRLRAARHARAARRTPATPTCASRPAPAAPRRATGRRCSCACTRAGPSGTATRSRSSMSCATRRPASAAPRCTSSATTPTAICRARPACIGWCASARSTPTPAGRRRSPRST